MYGFDVVGLGFVKLDSLPKSLCTTPQQKDEEQNRNRNSEKPK
jgi:hypothetical protein